MRATFGDAIAALPTMRAMGGGTLVLTERANVSNGGRASLKGERFEMLKPLLLAQPYVDDALWMDEPPKGCIDFRRFRDMRSNGRNLAQWQAAYAGVKINESPWLVAEADPKYAGRAVFARSLRYHNPNFDWTPIINRHPNRLFVGLHDEYMHFQTAWGKPMEWMTAPDLLTLARIVKGCSIFVGNQSAPFWIAAGLGVPIIQETWAQSANSIVRRPNCRYIMGGEKP